jgi:hypothetical protein
MAAERVGAGIGITARGFPWRVGFAQRSSNISRKRRVNLCQGRGVEVEQASRLLF